MTHEDQDEKALNRRNLLRGGAVLAGAAGATVIGSAMLPTAANAGVNSVLIGVNNEGSATTGLTLTPAGAAPALSLANAGGPSLRLAPISVNEDMENALDIGDIVNTSYGPLIGVNYGGTKGHDILVTGNDLNGLPRPLAIYPQRLLDTRKPGGRERIIRKSSSDALSSSGKLKGGHWIDVAIGPSASEFMLWGVFATAAVIDPAKNGYLIVYPPTDERPDTSNINYRAGANVSNAIFVPPGEFDDAYVIRIWTSQTTHLLFDLSGVVASQAEPMPDNKVGSRRAERQAKQMARLTKSLVRS
jgi:hypothetical protein